VSGVLPRTRYAVVREFFAGHDFTVHVSDTLRGAERWLASAKQAGTLDPSWVGVRVRPVLCYPCGVPYGSIVKHEEVRAAS
jgi:hypothetical protein